MSPESRRFPDEFQTGANDQTHLSDQELERLMSGAFAPEIKSGALEGLETGARVTGTVIEVGPGEILLELDRKTLGVIDRAELGDEPMPAVGSSMKAEFVRHDREKDVYVLSVKVVRTEVSWDELRPGAVVEGPAVEATKGGLVIDLKGVRAFLPISQIERGRVENIDGYVGRKLRCEVLEVERAQRNVVLSRRTLLEREGEVERKRALEKLQPGVRLSGLVVRNTEHGAFVSLGALDGLIHSSKLQKHFRSARGAKTLEVGQRVEVEVATVDAARGRVGLDLVTLEADAWEPLAAGYKVGDAVTCLVSRIEEDGAVLALEDGLAAVLPREAGVELPDAIRPGALVQASIAAIDPVRRRITVRRR